MADLLDEYLKGTTCIKIIFNIPSFGNLTQNIPLNRKKQEPNEVIQQVF